MASECSAACLTANEATQLLFYDSDRSSHDLDLDYNSGVHPEYEPPKKKGKGKTTIDLDLLLSSSAFP